MTVWVNSCRQNDGGHQRHWKGSRGLASREEEIAGSASKAKGSRPAALSLGSV
eukprot:CAMPEP_0119352152 /NCGR_PEP_ID=MMETSP1334-20130426/1469_1 /TAXON_ID=127549 /ORGANISM="Calcidiscus leptoporus, Strain RCC1130" /LENGTH=52 /DNA_ID=CAMNT_0007365131 /DNA_START=1158 /DNA_END=1313 /DNA_ORIENTATION=+